MGATPGERLEGRGRRRGRETPGAGRACLREGGNLISVFGQRPRPDSILVASSEKVMMDQVSQVGSEEVEAVGVDSILNTLDHEKEGREPRAKGSCLCVWLKG